MELLFTLLLIFAILLIFNIINSTTKPCGNNNDMSYYNNNRPHQIISSQQYVDTVRYEDNSEESQNDRVNTAVINPASHTGSDYMKARWSNTNDQDSPLMDGRVVYDTLELPSVPINTTSAVDKTVSCKWLSETEAFTDDLYHDSTFTYSDKYGTDY